MVTITDVAREAGVSKTTVSYVISRPSRVSAESRDKVRRAMRKLGYTVNHAARALSTARSMTLGVLAPAEDEASMSITRGAYLCALSNFARLKGYDLLLLSDPDGVRAVRDAADARKVDGLIIMDIRRDDPRVRAAVEGGLPTVLLGIPADSMGLDEVDTDFERAAVQLVRHFAERGHRDIVLLHSPEGTVDGGANFAVRFRRSAVAEAERLGVTMRVPVCDADRETGGTAALPGDPGERLRRALETFPEATGLIIDDDNAILAAPQVFLELGVRVPEDMSVAVAVPNALRARMRIPYTAVDIDLQSVAEETVDTLIRRIDDASRPAMTRLISQPLSDRGSVATVSH